MEKKIRKQREKKERKYFFPFTRTHHTATKLMEEFTLNTYTNNYMQDVVRYITKLDDFDRVVFLLNIEYNSYRLVAEETNVHYLTIRAIIMKIKEDLLKIINNSTKKEL
ncbi:MAG: hypothetical protein HGA35_02655 [Erysipelotrichaceae bacterium]|nr:hypothetical protein [Erysipelotrichaceae bacterium]